ncbi:MULTISPECIES: APC family permease [Micromonospora]|uniref:APC family permease n=1 Tax=Micromonospora profundi TaxID=1420889 RepID=A0AAJ6HRW4_9ACTN|nr:MULTISPECIES: APC family permease [Micromonospora]KOX10517.1 amino acid permease [Micromonospora sp. NRRL B-16802]NJC13474.1 amino acid transporter [Micromonospora profundi]WLS45072.1 APC family permease [Micromonospora profundi]
MPSTGDRPSNVSEALARGRLGIPSVIFFVLSAAAPLTVVAGVVTTGYGVIGVTGIPLAFLLIAAVLALFSVGYVAMSRRVENAGAFYAYISRGLGRPAGVGAAWMALVAYNALQVGLYGTIGVAAEPVLDRIFGGHPHWSIVALVAWAIVGLLGLLRVDINGLVLAALLVAEIVIVLIFDLGQLGNPAGGEVNFAGFSPDNLFVPGVGAVLVLAILGFVGFESAVVFSEESKDPKRTVPLATYLSVAIVAALYALSSWSMTVAVGSDRIVAEAGEQSVGLIFNLAAAQLGDTAVTIGQVLFLTSVLAAMISFHNTTARYTFALGRERVLPAVFGRTSPRSGAPRAASLAQSALGLLVIVLYAVNGWDPVVKLFFWVGTSGGFGVLLLIATTSVAVIAYFARYGGDETLWRRAIAPGLATLALVVIIWLAVSNFANLLGVAPDSNLRWMLPAVYPVAAALGIGWALLLRRNRPDTYARIGLGAASAAAAARQAEQRSAPLGAEIR